MQKEIVSIGLDSQLIATVSASLPYGIRQLNGVHELRHEEDLSSYKLIISPLTPPGGSLDDILAIKKEIPLFLITDLAHEEQAMDWVRKGAINYMCQDATRYFSENICALIRCAVRRYEERQELAYQKEIERKLKESEKRFYDIALSTADCLWDVDTSLRYTHLSGRVKEIFGYEVEELIGKTPFELMPPQEAETVKFLYEKIMAERRPLIDFQTHRKTKDGKDIYILTNGIPIFDENHNLLGYRGVNKNITDQVMARIELKTKNLELEHTNITLRGVLAQIEAEKSTIYKTIATNIEKNIKPIVRALRNSSYANGNELNKLDLLEQKLNEINCDFFKKIEDLNLQLTPTEMQYCQYIKSNYSIKEIAEIQGISIDTAKTHGKNIRKKLGLTNKKISLPTYLENLQ